MQAASQTLSDWPEACVVFLQLQFLLNKSSLPLVFGQQAVLFSPSSNVVASNDFHCKEQAANVSYIKCAAGCSANSSQGTAGGGGRGREHPAIIAKLKR